MLKNKNQNRNNEPTIAPGMDDSDELEQAATKTEIEKGEFTQVIKLSYDEVGPS